MQDGLFLNDLYEIRISSKTNPESSARQFNASVKLLNEGRPEPRRTESVPQGVCVDGSGGGHALPVRRVHIRRQQQRRHVGIRLEERPVESGGVRGVAAALGGDELGDLGEEHLFLRRVRLRLQFEPLLQVRVVAAISCIIGSDLWRFDTAASKWYYIPTAGNRPVGRAFAAMAFINEVRRSAQRAHRELGTCSGVACSCSKGYEGHDCGVVAVPEDDERTAEVPFYTEIVDGVTHGRELLRYLLGRVDAVLQRAGDGGLEDVPVNDLRDLGALGLAERLDVLHALVKAVGPVVLVGLHDGAVRGVELVVALELQRPQLAVLLRHLGKHLVHHGHGEAGEAVDGLDGDVAVGALLQKVAHDDVAVEETQDHVAAHNQVGAVVVVEVVLGGVVGNGVLRGQDPVAVDVGREAVQQLDQLLVRDVGPVDGVLLERVEGVDVPLGQQQFQLRAHVQRAHEPDVGRVLVHLAVHDAAAVRGEGRVQGVPVAVHVRLEAAVPLVVVLAVLLGEADGVYVQPGLVVEVEGGARQLAQRAAALGEHLDDFAGLWGARLVDFADVAPLQVAVLEEAVQRVVKVHDLAHVRLHLGAQLEYAADRHDVERPREPVLGLLHHEHAEAVADVVAGDDFGAQLQRLLLVRGDRFGEVEEVDGVGQVRGLVAQEGAGRAGAFFGDRLEVPGVVVAQVVDELEVWAAAALAFLDDGRDAVHALVHHFALGLLAHQQRGQRQHVRRVGASRYAILDCHFGRGVAAVGGCQFQGVLEEEDVAERLAA
ncbi:kelch repeat domain containing protein, putative [Babesia caballi]|uniref:Kelch repeat domain containing protein, putative n=1 Tax=Babesia caballi TaxID=5871 RepID=A0AAV4LRA5_BABCB|nr:kelch repeat domain containing protein, putative [Babesia caballi]